jgi:hypothetical protein
MLFEDYVEPYNGEDFSAFIGDEWNEVELSKECACESDCGDDCACVFKA